MYDMCDVFGGGYGGIQGPPGPAGEKGERGPAGSKGDKGDVGPEEKGVRGGLLDQVLFLSFVSGCLMCMLNRLNVIM